jgi:alginate O-acetyltransferase complex protein AlgI
MGGLMSGGVNVGVATVPRDVPLHVQAAVDSRAPMAQTDVIRFCGFMAQLALLLAVFYVYDLEEPVFGILAALIVSGFAIHYWLPFQWKETFYIGWSLAGAFVLLTPATAALLIVSGLVLYGVVTVPVAFKWRLIMVLALTAVLVYARATLGLGIPFEFWPVFGSIFMFRFLIYLYDAAHAKARPQLRDFLTYFFVLPNYYFLLFPVVDYQTHRQTYFRRNINDVAQQGIVWIARGTIQLLLYRLIYHWKGPSNAPEEVTTFAALASTIVLTYLLYLRVSGQFHIIVGFLHLFGYDLPETHRRYLLARSLTDFWRRINIYWKDFMVKMVYFPLYFRLRRGGEVRAQVIATVAVFVVTWFLHAYQWFWLRGEFLMTGPDTLFWAILGGLVTINLLMERKRPSAARAAWRKRLEPLKVVGTFFVIVTLWSLWNSPSVAEWTDLITWWRLG